MESREHALESDREKLINNPEVKRLIRVLSLAESGFFLLEAISSKQAQQIIDITQQKLSKDTQQEVDIEKYTVKIDQDYLTMSNEEIAKKFGGPFQRWLESIQINKDSDSGRARLFVIDGTQVKENDRRALIDHFSFMNMLRDHIAGNKRGPVLIILPKYLEIEKDLGMYNDLMSCCSGRYHIDESAGEEK